MSNLARCALSNRPSEAKKRAIPFHIVGSFSRGWAATADIQISETGETQICHGDLSSLPQKPITISPAGGWRLAAVGSAWHHLRMEDLQPYIRDIVEPTFSDFRRNPGSMRHAYLTCVATYHTVDRAAYPKSPGNLRKAWGRESFQFKIVDMVAHKFKHVISDEENRPPVKGSIPLSHAVFGAGTLNTYTFNSRTLGSGGIDLHNLFYVVNEAIAFIKTKSA